MRGDGLVPWDARIFTGEFVCQVEWAGRVYDAEACIHSMDEMISNQPQTAARHEHREGKIARSIEQQTAKLPSDVFLWAAFGAIGASLALQIASKEHAATFVGHWAPTLLILGVYNKIVKLQGSDGA